MLIREEMRRVICYLKWQVAWWTVRVESRSDATREVQAGVKGYVLRQASLYGSIMRHFETTWTTPAKQVACRVLAGGPDPDLEGADLDEFFQQ